MAGTKPIPRIFDVPVFTTMWYFFIMFVALSASASNSQAYEKPTARSYFHELSELGKYKEMADSFNNNDNAYSQFQSYFEDVLDAVSLFNVRQTGKSDHMQGILENTALLSILETKNVSSSSCINDTGRLITSLLSGESWALQFIDAAGKPGPSLTKGWLNFVGNYDQCKEARSQTSSNRTRDTDEFGGMYCTQQITFVIEKLAMPIPVTFGFCLPNTCSSREVTELFKELFSQYKFSVIVGDAQCINKETKVTAATVVAIVIIIVLGTLVILGTFYDVLFVQKINYLPTTHFEINENGKGPESDDISGSQLPNSIEETQPLLTKMVVTNAGPSITVQLLLAFSLYTNGKKLLNTSQPAGSLGSIHGIRFLSMTWVVLGHCYAFGSMKYTLNLATEIQVLLHRTTFDAIANALVSVDTFFTLSGLLTSYLTLQEFSKHGPLINWPKFYFHRFWRLTPPYMFSLVIVLGLQQYMGQGGPFWTDTQPADKKFCEDNWWTNLLYVNNLVNTKEQCFGHAWYLANDMQFFILSPIMLIPFCFHWLAGIASCTCFLLASFIATGVLSYQKNWPDTILLIRTTSPDYFTDYYIVPWCRIGPYVIGILAGFILAIHKGKPIRMRWWVAMLGWLVAAVSALAVLYGITGDISGEHPNSRSVRAFYNTVSRSVWGACVCWVIVACSTGYGGPIQSLLSWSPFVVLGRLTYVTYLIHLCIIYVFFGSFGSLFYFNDIIMPVIFMGLLVFTNMVAFIAVLVLESPMIGLEKVLLAKKRQD